MGVGVGATCSLGWACFCALVASSGASRSSFSLFSARGASKAGFSSSVSFSCGGLGCGFFSGSGGSGGFCSGGGGCSACCSGGGGGLVDDLDGNFLLGRREGRADPVHEDQKGHDRDVDQQAGGEQNEKALALDRTRRVEPLVGRNAQQGRRRWRSLGRCNHFNAALLSRAWAATRLEGPSLRGALGRPEGCPSKGRAMATPQSRAGPVPLDCFASLAMTPPYATSRF